MNPEAVSAQSSSSPQMPDSNERPDNLDEISRRTLLLLSSGQGLSIHEIARALGSEMAEVWNNLIALERLQFVAISDGRIRLGTEGVGILEKWGIIKPTPVTPIPSTFSKQPLRAALVGNVPDLIIWAIMPVMGLLALVIMLLMLWIALAGAVPFDERLAEIPIAMVLIGIAAFVFQRYWQLSFHQIPEFESYVVFRLGNCIGSRGPGPTLLNPILDQWNVVDLRVSHLEVPHETCITRDNVQIDVDFVLYWRVEQPVWSVTKVQSAQESLNLLATALLRAVIAHFPFNEVLNQRERINESLKEKIDEISTDWGVYVTTVEIREIKPPKDIVDSMHLQAAAEWKRQATVTESEGYKQAAIKRAEGDSQALGMLFEVAKGIDPKTLQLKYLDALAKLGESNSTKYVFPLEFTQLVKPFVNAVSPVENQATTAGQPANSLNSSQEDIALDHEIVAGSECPSTANEVSTKARIIGQEEKQAA